MTRREEGPAREESVSFSLRELEKLENERLAREERQRRETEDEERAAREAALARARDEAARAIQAETLARDGRERRSRDELAQREAMQKAVVEQARVGVEARARAEEAERERSHELELARLRAAQSGSRLAPLLVAALFGAVVAGVIALSVHLGLVAPERDRRLALAEMQARKGESERARLAQELDVLRRTNAELAARITHRETEPASTPPSSTKGQSGSKAKATSKSSAGKESPCLPRDPMCFSIEGAKR